MSKQQAVEKLLEMGAENLKQEDRFGNTRSGWWLDGVWLAPACDPIRAVAVVEGN